VVNRWNSLDQETVDVGSIISFKGRLDKIRKTRIGFYGFCMVRKALGLMGDWTPVRPHKVSYKVSYQWAAYAMCATRPKNSCGFL